MFSKRFYNDNRAVLPMKKAQVDAKKRIKEKMNEGRYSFCSMPCCVCETVNFEVISEKDCYGIYCPVVICKTCGLVQQNPKMSKESYSDLYEREYRNLYDGESDEGAARNYFFYQRERGKDIFNYISTKNGAPFRGKRILEVGCGAGGILKYFKDQESEIFGIDPAMDYVEYGRSQGLSLQVATLQGAKVPWKPDIVIYNNVVEHLLNPVAEFKKLAEFIDGNTLLYIEVPNLKGLVKNYGSDLLKFIEIAHTFYFTLPALKNVMNRAGYSFLHGSEGMAIRAIFTFSPQKKDNTQFKSDYKQTMLFLRTTEKYCLAPTPAKIIFWAKNFFVVLLKKTGLFHWFFQKIYRKISH